jgi:hypothetical protein
MGPGPKELPTALTPVKMVLGLKHINRQIGPFMCGLFRTQGHKRAVAAQASGEPVRRFGLKSGLLKKFIEKIRGGGGGKGDGFSSFVFEGQGIRGPLNHHYLLFSESRFFVPESDVYTQDSKPLDQKSQMRGDAERHIIPTRRLRID